MCVLFQHDNYHVILFISPPPPQKINRFGFRNGKNVTDAQIKPHAYPLSFVKGHSYENGTSMTSESIKIIHCEKNEHRSEEDAHNFLAITMVLIDVTFDAKIVNERN